MTAAPVLNAHDPAAILEAARLLREGGVVVVPTDTVYGLASSALHTDAVRRVFEIKQRPTGSRLPVLLSTAADLSLLVADVPPVAWMLIDRFWPGPLTLVLPAHPSVSPLITAGGGTVAVRVPAARSCLELLQTLGEPIVGTSANLSGEAPALTAEEAVRSLGTEVDAVLQADGEVACGQPSTVVELSPTGVVVHRIGAIDADSVRDAVGATVPVTRLTTGRMRA